MYLAFSAYGIGNILEGVIKQATSQQIPYNPLSLLRGSKPVSVINPTTRGQKLMAGLSKPLELESAIPRIEMAGEVPSARMIEDLSPETRKVLDKWRSVLSGGPIGRFFIDLPGRFGVHQRWDYYRKAFLTFLGEEEATAVLSALAKNIDDAVKVLPDDVLKSLNITKHELESELLERAITGTSATRNMLDDIVADRLMLAEDIAKREARKQGKKIGERRVSADQALSDRISGGRVGEAAGKYPLVPQPFTDDLIQSASDGSLWSKGGTAIDDKIENYTAGMYDYFVHTPDFYKERFRERVDGILALEPRNRDEFMGMLDELQNLQGFYGESVDDVIRAMNELEHKMRTQMAHQKWSEWRGQYTREVYEGMGSYGDVAQGGFDDLVAKLEDDLGKYFNVDEQASVSKLFTAWTDEQRYLKNFWAKRRREELEMIATKPKGKEAVARFWDDFFGAQDAAHAQRRIDQAPFREAAIRQQYLTSEALGTLGFYPPTVDAGGRKLSKMDIATLYHSHPQQMGQSMLRLETMTLKPRSQFISEVRVQANIMAERAGSSANKMGFTDEAIGNIYDDVLRDMYMSPEAASVLEPHLMELKALKDEVWNIYNTKGVAKGTADDLQRWLDDLGDVLEDVPGYATPKAIVPAKAPSQTVLESFSSAEPNVLTIAYRGKDVGTLELRIPPATPEGVLGVHQLAMDTPRVLNREFLESVSLELEGVARRRGFKFIEVESAPQHVKMYESVGYRSEELIMRKAVSPAPISPARGLSPEFQASKQRAADNASKEYYKDWADYTNENATTAGMRMIYPFWTYELHRLFWLPRANIRTPGLFKAWGTYMDNTEDGYFHIPGTSLEINPLRGTVFMGGMIRLIRKDYPEYYDRFPEVSEYFDFYSRYGFYPATYLNFLKIFGGKTALGRTNFGEILPAWVKTPLNAYIALQPESAAAKLLLDTILAEPFRDYTTVLIANGLAQQEQKTFNGMDIADKVAENLPLTEEEQELWTRAVQQHGWMGAIMEQAGVLRIRTEEQIAAWEASGKLIQELTGYTLEEQLWIRRHGFRVGDYAQLAPLEQALLSEMDAMKYHSGVFSSLMPSTWQEEDRRRREFFGEVRSYSDSRKSDVEELNRQVRLPIGAEGRITMTQWSRELRSLKERNANFFTDLSETERYMNVAITMEDTERPDGTIREGMITRAKDREQIPPIEHPAREILNAYYSIELEKKIDPASGASIDDWDGYFLKIDTIIRALEGAERDDLIQSITKNLSDLEMLRWEISRRYFRGYNRRQEAIVTTLFTEEEQALIKRWIFGTPAERDAMQEIEIDGRKLISAYQSAVSITGQNLRILSPELDAWLQFFEITDTTLTEGAAELYSQYRQDWGIPE